MREYEARHALREASASRTPEAVSEITAEAVTFLTPQTSIRRKGGRHRRRKSNESISVFRGERDFYEKLMAALPGEEVEVSKNQSVGIDQLIQKTNKL